MINRDLQKPTGDLHGDRMTQEWGTLDERIGAWLDSGRRFEECPDVKRTMIFGGDLEKNYEHQGRHLDALMSMSLGESWDEVLEVGAGVGDFAMKWWEMGGWPERYWIYDLPNVMRIQQGRVMPAFVKWAYLVPDIEGLVVSLFALSEMGFDEREEILKLAGMGNAMFFAYQDEHNGMDNAGWFGRLAKKLRRRCSTGRCYPCGRYMFIEGVERNRGWREMEEEMDWSDGEDGERT